MPGPKKSGIYPVKPKPEPKPEPPPDTPAGVPTRSGGLKGPLEPHRGGRGNRNPDNKPKEG